MFAVDTLVPDFDRALARLPGAAPAWRVLNRSVEENLLPDRSAMLVRLAVAQNAGGEYSRWVMARLAAKEGMSAEDVFLATAGTARNPREAAIVRAARTMASNARFTDTTAYRELTVMLGAENAARVISHVALALLACDVLDSVAPGREAASPSRRGA